MCVQWPDSILLSRNDKLLHYNDRTCALKDYLFFLTHKFRRSILKKSDVSKVVFWEAKDSTRSHLKGFCIYSSIGGSKVGPKWAENPTFSSYTVISVLKIQNTASAWKNLVIISHPFNHDVAINGYPTEYPNLVAT